MPAQLAPGAIIQVEETPDPGGQNPKVRRFVVLERQNLPTGEVKVVGAFVTGTFPRRLPDDHVAIKQWAPNGRCRTGLTKPSAVVCSPNYIYRREFKTAAEFKVIGCVNGQLRAAIVAKVNELRPSPGGEAGPPTAS